MSALLAVLILAVLMAVVEPVRVYAPAAADLAAHFEKLVNAESPIFWLQCLVTNHQHLINALNLSHISEGIYDNRTN